MAEKSVAREGRERSYRSTRHHRCDHEFLELLEEDFGVSQFSLRQAFMGMPSAPKKQAIALCEWAIRTGCGDTERAGEMLRGWAKKNDLGMYNPAMTGAPLTFGGSEASGFEMEGV